MSTFLPRDVQQALDAARKQALRKNTRLRVQVDGEIYPILQFSDTIFSVDSQTAPRLRGVVDIYEGSRHLYQALIVTSRQDAGEWLFEFKRNTMTKGRPALDYWIEAYAPKGLLAAD